MKAAGSYAIPSSRKISVGELEIGGSFDVRLQSMVNTDTNRIDECIAQYNRLVEAGAAMVRFTIQGRREINNLREIVEYTKNRPLSAPVVADIHFNPALAEEAATFCDKVRINPGNYTPEPVRKSPFLLLLETCRKHRTALRIGVNHGSLSPRILNRFGDTPEGMVESAMEYLRVCGEENFSNVVVSLKASNVRLMVYAVRLMVKQMLKENLYFPIHLGVTEAGNVDEGRLRSAAGIATLLSEGIGDTIRVSLTEDPVIEIPVAAKIVSLFPKPVQLPYDPLNGLPWEPCGFERPVRTNIPGMNNTQLPVVLSAGTLPVSRDSSRPVTPSGSAVADLYVTSASGGPWIEVQGSRYPLKELWDPGMKGPVYISLKPDCDSGFLTTLPSSSVVILKTNGFSLVQVKKWLIDYYASGRSAPVILHRSYDIADRETFLLQCGGEVGSLLVDGIIDGIWIENRNFSYQQLTELSFQILQASGARSTRTEYIACPSCGRTLFDIETALEEVKSATGHLSGLKIAVMGCIVNGPGEMADADYGYVGAGKNRVSLYRGKQVMVKQVPLAEAVDKLVELIKEHGDWSAP